MTASVAALRCEYRVNPLGIDVARPRLSWELRDARRGARQTAYQIQVGTQAEDASVWDSGRVESDQSIQVGYAGPLLASGQRAWWRVRACDAQGEATPWSPPAWWEMGLLQRADWQAEWIGAPAQDDDPASPYLRTEFNLQTPVAAARLYATALGLYECCLNGERIGADVFTPGWTDYRQRVQYQVYDVTPLLRPGVNALGAILGDGWAVGNVAWLDRKGYVDQPRLLAQLNLTYTDGSRETIATGGGWRVTRGPILSSDMLMGEVYDARRELAGWNAPGYDASAWQPAAIFPDTGIARTATNGTTVQRQEELRPLNVREQRDGETARWIFDMGQNMVGWARLRVSGPAGTTVTLRYAEVLNPDGSLYTANLRRARNTDQYTLQGGDEEVWEPRFVFHGFRYVELSGFPGRPSESTLTGVVVHSELPPTGEFECSDALLNQLQHNIVWGQKGNFVDVPTDCPQRDERLGWTGDAQVFSRTAAFNRDVAAFFTKWTRDLEEAQSPAGDYPSVAPNPSTTTMGHGGPAWADAGVIVPWNVYQCYGDTRLLEQHYPSMQKFIDFMLATSRDGLRNYDDYTGFKGYGDWLALDGSPGTEGGTSKELIGTAFFAYSTRLLARIAAVLGKRDDAERYEALFQTVRSAFQERFVGPEGVIDAGTQTSYVLALHFDLLPEAARPAALDAIVRDVQQRGNHLSTGFVGASYLPWVLSDNGRPDVAFALLRQTTCPSWLYPVTQGATTIWERWDGWTEEKGFQDPGMNSFNHYAYGAIGAWLYAVVGGIDLDPHQPAYKHIHMRPHPGDLAGARVRLHSPFGPIESQWSRDGSRFDWRVVVPANATATVTIPASASQTVREGGMPLDVAAGVSDLRLAAEAIVCEVAAGEYRFTVQS